MKIENISFKNSKRLKLAGVLHLPTKKINKVVIICHGFTGHKDEKQLAVLAKTLQKAGFAAFRFDFTGNGKSEGEFYESTISQEVSDVGSVVSLLKDKGFSKFAIVGHSLGGNIAILATEKFKFNCTAIFASGFKLSAIPNFFHFDKLKFENGLEKVRFWGLRKIISKNYIKDFMNKDIEKSLENLKIPILIVHGSADRTVSVKTAKYIFEKIPCQKELVVIKGADHIFYKKESALAEIVSAFMKVHL